MLNWNTSYDFRTLANKMTDLIDKRIDREDYKQIAYYSKDQLPLDNWPLVEQAVKDGYTAFCVRFGFLGIRNAHRMRYTHLLLLVLQAASYLVVAGLWNNKLSVCSLLDLSSCRSDRSFYLQECGSRRMCSSLAFPNTPFCKVEPF